MISKCAYCGNESHGLELCSDCDWANIQSPTKCDHCNSDKIEKRPSCGDKHITWDYYYCNGCGFSLNGKYNKRRWKDLGVIREWCDRCHGAGVLRVWGGGDSKCEDCNGRGWTPHKDRRISKLEAIITGRRWARSITIPR